MYDDVKIYGTFLFGKRRTYLFKCYETSDGNNKAGIEYKDSDTPYIITKSDLINNMNYVTPQLYVKHDFHRSDNGNYISESNDGGTDTIKPTLMHEHVVPCICPDSTPVAGWDKKDIGTVNVRYTLAKGGQATGDGANIKSIPVKITKRNCEAYQSNKWKSQEVQDAYNSKKYYTYYVKQ